MLACDLAGVEQLAEQMGPEFIHTALNGFLELARIEVERYGGSINQSLGSGFLALFGAPVAYEDHVQRGALAAIGLNKALETFRPTVGWSDQVRLEARMGLDTGKVVVGGSQGMAVGASARLAVGLQTVADPGSVLASKAIARAVADSIEFSETQKLQVPGIGQPIEATVVQGVADPAAMAANLRARGGEVSPLVGRERELAVLESLKDLAAEGSGQVVGLTGVAGAGKSRLLHEFRSRLNGQRVVYLSGSCVSYGAGIPYFPLKTMVRTTSGISAQDGADRIQSLLQASLKQVGCDPEQSLPYFLQLLGIEEGTEALAGLDARAIQMRTFAAMQEMIQRASESTLVVLELEDLHWIDQTSEAFLASLIEGVSASRVLLVLTYRAGYRAEWLEKSYATQITMHRLSEQESQKLVAGILERANLSSEVATELIGKGEGNPFYLEELARSLVDGDGQASVPDNIQGLVMARIDQIPEDHKRLLQMASVLGREFSLQVLTTIWDRSSPVDPLLDDLKKWEFLYETPTASWGSYFFKHALTQEVAYQSLLKIRRQELHLAAARVIEEMFAGQLEDAYDRLTYHYPLANEPGKTVYYLMKFAHKAARGGAYTESADSLRKGLEHAAHLPESERDAKTLEVLIQLADSLLPLAGFPETLDLLQRYHEIGERIADPSLKAGFFFWLAHTHTYLGNQTEAGENAQHSITAAQEASDEATEGKACYVLGRDGFWSGQFAQGIEYSLKAIALLERSGEPWWQGQAYWVAGFNHYVLGQFEPALEALERAKDIGDALDDYRLDTSWSTGYFYASVGEWEAGIEACESGLGRSEDPLNTAAAMGFLGYSYLEKQDIPKALSTLSESVDRIRETGMQQLLGWFLAYLAEAHLLDGEVEKASQAAEESLEVNRNANFGYGAAMSHRALGRIARASNSPADHLQDAFEAFKGLQVPFEVGRCRLDLAMQANDKGDKAAAKDELVEARRIFEELHVPRYVEKVDALSEELSVEL